MVEKSMLLQVSSVGSVSQEKYGGQICNPKKMAAENLNMMNTRGSSASANAMLCNDHNFNSKIYDIYIYMYIYIYVNINYTYIIFTYQTFLH